ncbi:MAG: hypothetical protein AAGA62_12975, partial [Bacteroidota bacterium]
ALDALYHRHLYRLESPGIYQRMDDGSTFTAILKGVDLHGRLRLEKSDGQEELFDLKSIAFL